MSYKSDKYPWNASAARYEQQFHRPKDYDAVLLDVAGRAGDGHYIAHWRWSGYYDCVDIDRRSSAVANVYGVDTGNSVFNKIEHCQYLGYTSVDTKCMKAPFTADICINDLPSWKAKDSRLGVNVVLSSLQYLQHYTLTIQHFINYTHAVSL